MIQVEEERELKSEENLQELSDSIRKANLGMGISEEEEDR